MNDGMEIQMKAFAMIMTLLTGMTLASGAKAQQASVEQRALLAYLKVIPGAEAEFLAAAKDVIEKSRQEAGNLVYTLHQSVSDPTQFVLYELFKSDADLQAHRQASYVIGFLKTVNPILVPNGFVLQDYSVVP